MKNFIFSLVLFLIMLTTANAQVPDTLPTFKGMFKMENNQAFTSDSLSQKGINVLVFYDPGCGHCQELASEIGKSLDKFKEHTDFYFVAMQEKGQVEGMLNMFAKELISKPNVHFLHDPTGQFILAFNPKNFPFAYIYNAETGKEIKHFNGEGKLRKLLPYLDIRH
ncbi:MULTISPECIES: TlpA family protein disulfide reductase [Sphingobacterium]|uniref:Redoxin n=1 Tax=Sphingobacterium hotanense TaxID=649196 RepID=A0ABT7NRV6_9SPHI|nr:MULTISPECIES: thioredoxin domain-containing protein [Sphingobacterium]MDM1049952.1 redoxin [Sphingobacterium hotanense]